MWLYKDRIIESHEDLFPECTDFVYVITYDNGQKYIGKKAIRAVRRKPPLKGYKRNRRIMTDLPFKNYQGSHINAKILNPVKKEIMFQCSSRKTATYLEMSLLVHMNAIFEKQFVNENIGGKFFSDTLDGLLDA